MKKALIIISGFWIAGCLFILVDLGRHIFACSPPCPNHWPNLAFHMAVLGIAILGVAGKKRPAFLLFVPAILFFVFCGIETILSVGGWIAGAPTFELLYRPVLGTILGLGTIIALPIVKKMEQPGPGVAGDRPQRAPPP